MTENQQIVSRWLAAVGEETGHSISLGEDGHCTILFGDDLECVVEVDDNSDLCFIYVPLVRAPDQSASRAQLYQTALELNMFSLSTGGATVSYDPRSDFVVLTFAFKTAEAEEEFFKKILAEMLDLAVDLHEKLLRAIPEEHLEETTERITGAAAPIRI